MPVPLKLSAFNVACKGGGKRDPMGFIPAYGTPLEKRVHFGGGGEAAVHDSNGCVSLGSTCAPRVRNFAFPQSQCFPPQYRNVFSCLGDTKILSNEDPEALPTRGAADWHAMKRSSTSMNMMRSNWNLFSPRAI